MKTLYTIRFFLLVIIAFIFSFFASPVYAARCTGLPHIGNTVISDCVLTVASAMGADQANNDEHSTVNTAQILIGSGAFVTINSGGILTGSLKMAGGTVAIDTGGVIKPNEALYVTDEDADGWSADPSTLYTATASGRRRLSVMRSLSEADCDDKHDFRLNNLCTPLSIGPMSPSTVEDVADTGTIAWLNPSNASVADSIHTTIEGSSDDISHYLVATNFGFSIPNGATIVGIVVEYYTNTYDSIIGDASIQIVKNGNISGNDNANLSVDWNSAGYNIRGSPTDLWGVPWAAPNINSPNFGVAISGKIKTAAFGADGFIDHIRITVHYTP